MGAKGRLFKRGHIYYCWVPNPKGGTKKKSTNCTDPKAAATRAAELEREALDPQRAKAKTATLREAFERLIETRAAEAKGGKKSAETVIFYRKKSGVVIDGVAEVLQRSPNADVYLSEVDAALVDDYIAVRREDGAKETTIAKELTSWRAAMRIAKRRKLFTEDMDAVFPVGFSPEYEPRDRWVTPEEVLKLMAALIRPAEIRRPTLDEPRLRALRERRRVGVPAPELAREFGLSVASVNRLTSPLRVDPTPTKMVGHGLFAIVCYCIATSCEPSAIWRARRPDIAPDLQQVIIRGSKNRRRKDRPVPITLLPFALLLDFARVYGDGELEDEEGQFLFSGKHRANFGRELGEACVRAGIPHITATDLRRTHGKWLRLVGVAPGAIGPSMGHADSRMVERVYGRATGAELAGVQRAQIVNLGGLLMGGTTSVNPPSSDQNGEPEVPFQREIYGAQSRNRTRDTGIENPSRSPSEAGGSHILPTPWAANGQLTSAERIAPAKDVPAPEVAPDPVLEEPGAAQLGGEDCSAAADRPGLARASAGLVGVRIEVDGRLVARTDVLEGEPVDDIRARLELAVGQRRGVR